MVDVQIHPSRESIELELTGSLNEKSILNPSAIAETPRIIFNLANLKGINSVGLGTWINFTKALAERKVEMIFRNCPSVFKDQVAMLPSLIPLGSVVESFHAPYICYNCDHEEEPLLKMSELNFDNAEPFPKKACSSCHGKLVLDDLADEQLIFIKELKKQRQKLAA